MAWPLCGYINTDDIYPASEARSNFKHHKVKEGGGGFYGTSGFHLTFMSLIDQVQQTEAQRGEANCSQSHGRVKQTELLLQIQGFFDPSFNIYEQPTVY